MNFPDLRIRLARDEDVPAVRLLVNAAYRELAEMGLNYTATYQDEEITRSRMLKGRTFLLCRDTAIIGTIHLREEPAESGRRAAYIGQFGILPEHKRAGLGTLLMDHVEKVAAQEGFDCLRLDTAKPALHLVRFYEKRGYRIVDETRFEGKTYESWIFEKPLASGAVRLEHQDL